MQHPSHRWAAARAVALLGGCASAVGAAWWVSGDLLRPVLVALAGSGPAGLAEVTFARVLDAVCATVLLGCVSWLALGGAVTVASYAAAVVSPTASATAVLETLADRGCPRRLRRLVLICLGVAMGAGATAPASAHSVAVPDRPDTHGTTAAAGLGGLALPDRTTGAAAAPARRSSVPDEPLRTVLVHPGDCLWTIAAQLLPADASDRSITATWHRLHRANAVRIGADPDLVLPGTLLRLPSRLPTELPTEREERR